MYFTLYFRGGVCTSKAQYFLSLWVLYNTKSFESFHSIKFPKNQKMSVSYASHLCVCVYVNCLHVRLLAPKSVQLWMRRYLKLASVKC